LRPKAGLDVSEKKKNVFPPTEFQPAEHTLLPTELQRHFTFDFKEKSSFM